MVNAIFSNNLDEVKNLHENKKVNLPISILITSVENKNIEMFKYGLEKKVKDDFTTLPYIIRKGEFEYVKAYFEAGYKYEHRLYPNEVTPLYEAVCKNDIELVKYVYEKCPIWMVGKSGELEKARKNGNKEIEDFCIANGALNEQSSDVAQYI
jgi:hypothetical protein